VLTWYLFRKNLRWSVSRTNKLWWLIWHGMTLHWILNVGVRQLRTEWSHKSEFKVYPHQRVTHLLTVHYQRESSTVTWYEYTQLHNWRMCILFAANNDDSFQLHTTSKPAPTTNNLLIIRLISSHCTQITTKTCKTTLLLQPWLYHHHEKSCVEYPFPMATHWAAMTALQPSTHLRPWTERTAKYYNTTV